MKLLIIIAIAFVLLVPVSVFAQTDEAITEYCKDNWKKAPQMCSNYIPKNTNDRNAHDIIAEKNIEKDQQRIKQFQLDMQNIVCPTGTEKQSSGLDVFCVSENDIQQSNTDSELSEISPILFVGFVLFIVIMIIVIVKKATGSENNNLNNSYNVQNNGYGNSLGPVKSNRNFSNNSSKKSRPAMPAYLRHKVLQRDNFRCTDCGATKNEISLHIDHILPWSKGGTHDPRNLQTLCRTCNLAKMTRKWIGGKK
jgi:5-methylcytosine-specific restriction enzyme A